MPFCDPAAKDSDHRDHRAVSRSSISHGKLHALGHHVRFYSYVCRARVRSASRSRTNATYRCCRSFCLRSYAWSRLMPRLTPGMQERVLFALLNRAVMLRLRPLRRFHLHVGLSIWRRHISLRSATTLPYGSNGGAATSCRRTKYSRRPQARSGRARLLYSASFPAMHSPIGSSFHHAMWQRAFVAMGRPTPSCSTTPTASISRCFGHAVKEAPISEPISRFSSSGLWCLRKGCDLLAEAVMKGRGTPHPCRPDWRFGFSDRRRPIFARRSGATARAGSLLCCGRRFRPGVARRRTRQWVLAAGTVAKRPTADLHGPDRRRRSRAHTPALAASTTRRARHDDIGALAHSQSPDGEIGGTAGRDCRGFQKPIARN